MFKISRLKYLVNAWALFRHCCRRVNLKSCIFLDCIHSLLSGQHCFSAMPPDEHRLYRTMHRKECWRVTSKCHSWGLLTPRLSVTPAQHYAKRELKVTELVVPCPYTQWCYSANALALPGVSESCKPNPQIKFMSGWVEKDSAREMSKAPY